MSAYGAAPHEAIVLTLPPPFVAHHGCAPISR
jgi:hypothetical protein